MMRVLLAIVAIVVSTVAVAHQGVENGAVMARMHAMGQIATHMKTLGDMAKGVTRFDVAKARTASKTIATHAAETPGLFRPEEHDPKSEALPSIWENYDDFTAKAAETERTALELSASISDWSDLEPALRRLGATCASCHKTYRE